jgi:hypothetical protein
MKTSRECRKYLVAEEAIFGNGKFSIAQIINGNDEHGERFLLRLEQIHVVFLGAVWVLRLDVGRKPSSHGLLKKDP